MAAPAILAEQLGRPVDVRPIFEPQRAALLELLSGLDREDWRRPTACPGWSVADVVAHVIGDVAGRLSGDRDGWPGRRPADGETLEVFIDRTNAEWVGALRRCSPTVLVDLLGLLGPQLDTHWASLDPEGPAVGVSWAGIDPSPCWFDTARELTEMWVHDRQIRDAVAAEPVTDRWLPTVLDVFARGLLHALRDDRADRITLVAEHPDGAQRWTLERRGPRWWFVTSVEAEADPDVRVDADSLWRRWVGDPGGEAVGARATGAAGPAAVVLDHVAIVRSTPPRRSP